jgi:ribosomal protein S18 acetylase RimI-like enzyme
MNELIIHDFTAIEAAAVRHLLQQNTGLHPDLHRIALEQLQDCLDHPGQSVHQLRTILTEEECVAGVASFAAVSGAEGAYRLYFIAIAPELQHRGLAGRLLTSIEREARRAGGRLMITEWPGDASAESFLEKMQYARVGCIEDYFATGRELLIHVKYFDTEAFL